MASGPEKQSQQDEMNSHVHAKGKKIARKLRLEEQKQNHCGIRKE